MAFDFFKRRSEEAGAIESKASAAGPVIAYHGAGRVAWSARDTVSLTRSGFAGNPVGFRAVKLIAEAAAAVPLVLQDNQQRFETHEFLQLVAAPNGAQGRAEFFEALFGQLLLSGDAYVEAVTSESGAPFEMHVLRSDRFELRVAQVSEHFGPGLFARLSVSG
jgi:phage portal protein BeeE